MRKSGLIIILFPILFLIIGVSNPLFSSKPVQDISRGDYLIMNGKLWRNPYLGVRGHAYFMTSDFLKGDITFNGKVFRDKTFKYDLYADEIILWVNSSTIIFLNKEMVNEFTLDYYNNEFRVINAGNDSTSVLHGYVNVYYEGPTSLYVKYRKEIELLAVDNKYDLFTQHHKIYIRKNGEFIQVSGKRQLYKLLADKKAGLKDFVKKNRLNVTKDVPQSFIPLLEYYDGLIH